MTVPVHLQRHATPAARAKLAKRFGLPDSPSMQDWPWEVASPMRLDDFLAAYDEPGLTDDERFVLMEMILQSFEDSEADLRTDQRWARAQVLLTESPAIHLGSVRYWAALGAASDAETFRISPYMRRLLGDDQATFGESVRGRPTRG